MTLRIFYRFLFSLKIVVTETLQCGSGCVVCSRFLAAKSTEAGSEAKTTQRNVGSGERIYQHALGNPGL